MTSFVCDMRRSGNALLRMSAIAAMGGLLFGYDTGVISGAVLYVGSVVFFAARVPETTDRVPKDIQQDLTGTENSSSGHHCADRRSDECDPRPRYGSQVPRQPPGRRV